MIMNDNWKSQFQRRMNRFSAPRSGRGSAISIKVRVTGGCFHRQHSPHAYNLIDDYLQGCTSLDAHFEEHESGPELLVWLAMGTAGITLAKSVIDLVTAIIKARSEGIKKGDSPSAPVELIVRKVITDDKIIEEKVLRFDFKDEVNTEQIEKALIKALEKIANNNEE